ncbi:MAG: biliverdin-producing heme oxygenase [Hyphomicrobium sp.]
MTSRPETDVASAWALLKSRRDMLRGRTASIHAALDRAVKAAGYFDTLTAYGDYLAAMHRFHSELDACLNACGRADQMIGTWQSRWRLSDRTTWLGDDLAAIGRRSLILQNGDVHMPAAGVVPRRAALDLTDASSCLGTLYVVIGSELGARLLVRSARALPLPPSGGATYLEGLGRSRDWADFLSVLETYPDVDREAMCAAAVQTFTVVFDHLAEKARA